MTALRIDVEPRVISPKTGDRIRLVDAVENFLLTHGAGCIALVGDPLETTLAIEAVRNRLDDRVRVLSEPYAHEVNVKRSAGVTLFSSARSVEWADLKLRLTPWDDDDVLDYLLAKHPAECGSVFPFIQACRRIWRPTTTLGWQEILGNMASNPVIKSPEVVIENHVRFLLREPKHFQLAYQWAKAVFEGDADSSVKLHAKLAALPQLKTAIILFRDIIFVRMILLLGWIETLRAKFLPAFLRLNTHSEFLAELARRLTEEPQTVEFLKLPASHPPDCQSVVASLLRRVDPSWRPRGKGWWSFSGADLAGVAWEGIEFTGTRKQLIEFGSANLARADLRRAKLTHVYLRNAKLHQVDLSGARLSECTANGADFSAANFSEAQFHLFEAPGADFTSASLHRANFNIVNLTSAKFAGARLNQAIFHEAAMQGVDLRDGDLRGARFERTALIEANLNEADFRDAYFELSHFHNCDFRHTELTGACFKSCSLPHCNLEAVEMPNAFFQGSDLSNAWLTDSVMPNANFRDAKLQKAALGGVQWEFADLRNADLEDVTFHFGSTRSGIVDSPYPSHGTRTGFYIDEFYEYPGKSIEEIRSANLRGADLRGAILDGVDFYLVDLRDALFDSKYIRHLQRCRAILS